MAIQGSFHGEPNLKKISEFKPISFLTILFLHAFKLQNCFSNMSTIFTDKLYNMCDGSNIFSKFHRDIRQANAENYCRCGRWICVESALFRFQI